MSRTMIARRGGRGLALLAVAAVVVGLALLGWGVLSQQSAPPSAADRGTLDQSPPSAEQPTPGTATDNGSPSGGTTESPSGGTTGGGTQDASDGDPLPLSPPTSLRIPALGIRTDVNPIGKNPDGSLAVPQPGPRLDEAAWFTRSPSPGQPGPSIIEGHVDTEQGGPSVFHDLADIRPGDKIRVTRRDDVTVTFTVDALRNVKKKQFPTELVYGGRNPSQPTLRLITCSQFDPDLGTHVGNTLVFASLTDVSRP